MKFREYHLHQILQRFEATALPLDVFLSRYFRAHTAIGSKDRRFISDAVYEKIRWRAVEGKGSEVCFPELFYHTLVAAYGEAKARELCEISNSRAPTTLRINPLKTSREALLEKWREAHPCKTSPWGIVFPQKINFFALPEFKQGLFEIQDEGSQLIAQLVKARPKDHVLDYCAGAGGKTLAFAPLMNNRGQIYLHDIRPLALREARKRLNRAGIQNIQFGLSPDLKGKMDWVLVDAPCSGSGTLRRNPDMKWKFDANTLPSLVQKQRTIFESALEYLGPKGKIVYATCSLFPEENQQQGLYFQERFNLQVEEELHILPQVGGMDGFYGIVLKPKAC